MKTGDQSRPHSGHERKDADVISLIVIAALLLLSGALVSFATWGLMDFLSTQRNAREKRPPKIASERADFPEPRLQIQPQDDLEKLRATENAELNSYGWIDRKGGVVRIPVERAMQLIAERGLPEVGAGQTPLQLMQARPQQGETLTPTPEVIP
jgi:hypothetical protein